MPGEGGGTPARPQGTARGAARLGTARWRPSMLPASAPHRAHPSHTADHAQATRSPTQTLTPHQSRPPTPSKEDPVPTAGARPPWNRSTRPPALYLGSLPNNTTSQHSTTPTPPSKPTHNTISSAKLPGLPTLCRPEQARAVRRPPDAGRGAGRGLCRTPGSRGRRPGRGGGGLASAGRARSCPHRPSTVKATKCLFQRSQSTWLG